MLLLLSRQSDRGPLPGRVGGALSQGELAEGKQPGGGGGGGGGGAGQEGELAQLRLDVLRAKREREAIRRRAR
eukprot:COSAG01_NODE_4504_length_4970_cov_4.822008_9_plen_73_part_00